MQWSALLYAPVLTYLLFAIDDIGEQFDVPFVAMPLAQMCDRITRDCQEVVAQAELTREMAEQIGADDTEGVYDAWAVVDAAEAVALEVMLGEERLVTAAAQDEEAATPEPQPLAGWEDPPGPRSRAGAASSSESGTADFGVPGAWSGGAGESNGGATLASAQQWPTAAAGAGGGGGGAASAAGGGTEAACVAQQLVSSEQAAVAVVAVVVAGGATTTTESSSPSPLTAANKTAIR